MVARLLIGLAVFFALAQFIPYERDRERPPVAQEPPWDSARTRELASRACFDCHSNQTRWPWHSSLAPFAWFTDRDVDVGRDVLNFSEWQRPMLHAAEAAAAVASGEMPPRAYRRVHRAARLSPAERSELARGLTLTTRHATSAMPRSKDVAGDAESARFHVWSATTAAIRDR